MASTDPVLYKIVSATFSGNSDGEGRSTSMQYVDGVNSSISDVPQPRTIVENGTIYKEIVNGQQTNPVSDDAMTPYLMGMSYRPPSLKHSSVLESEPSHVVYTRHAASSSLLNQTTANPSFQVYSNRRVIRNAPSFRSNTYGIKTVPAGVRTESIVGMTSNRDLTPRRITSFRDPKPSGMTSFLDSKPSGITSFRDPTLRVISPAYDQLDGPERTRTAPKTNGFTSSNPARSVLDAEKRGGGPLFRSAPRGFCGIYTDIPDFPINETISSAIYSQADDSNRRTVLNEQKTAAGSSPRSSSVLHTRVSGPPSDVQNGRHNGTMSPSVTQTKFPTRNASLNEKENIRSPSFRGSSIKDKCFKCNKVVYRNERVGPVRDVMYHVQCFKCIQCGFKLAWTNFFHNPNDLSDKTVYCKSHQPVAESSKGDMEDTNIQAVINKPKLAHMDSIIRKAEDVGNVSSIGPGAVSIRTAMNVPRLETYNQTVRPVPPLSPTGLSDDHDSQFTNMSRQLKDHGRRSPPPQGTNVTRM